MCMLPFLTWWVGMVKKLNSEIFLVKVGRVAPEILSHLWDVIVSVFGSRYVVGASLPIPEYGYLPRRNQYSAGAILDKLPRERGGHVLGVADLDFLVPGLNCVFGLAGPMRGRGVIALPRLREGFYGKHESLALFVTVTAKEAIHELGHAHGLDHCGNRDCVMSFSNSLLDTDRKRQGFCTTCTGKLQL